MVGQAFHLLGHPVAGEGLEGLDNSAMQRAPPLLEQRFVGHLLGEGMLEGIFDLGKETRLVEELGRLQMGKALDGAAPQAPRQQPAEAPRAPRGR